MNIDVDQVLVNFDGKPMQEDLGSDGSVPLRLSSVICKALMHTTQDEIREAPDPDARVRRWLLAQDVHKGGKVLIRAEDTADLKDRINRLFQTQVAAASMLAIDPAMAPRG